MALMIINKINGELKSLYRKKKYLTKWLHKMIWNALIQPHFGYACPTLHSNPNEKTKNKIEMMQKKMHTFLKKVRQNASII